MIFDPRFRTKFLEMLRISHKACLDTYTEIVAETLGDDFANITLMIIDSSIDIQI